MLREGLARRLPASERVNRRDGGDRSLFGSQLIFRRGRLELLQFELHLVEKAGASFAALAVNFAPHLLDGQTQMCDQSLRGRRLGPRLSKLGIAGTKQTIERVDIVGQGRGGGGHGGRRTDSSPTAINLLQPESPCRTRSPGALGMAPVDRLRQIAELRRRDRYDAAGRRRPDEPATLEALGIQRQAQGRRARGP